MSVTQASQLNPAGLAFHQVSKERWKDFSHAVQHLDQSFQEVLRNMSEDEKKSPIGGRVLLCQKAHEKVMSTFFAMVEQEDECISVVHYITDIS